MFLSAKASTMSSAAKSQLPSVRTKMFSDSKVLEERNHVSASDIATLHLVLPVS